MLSRAWRIWRGLDAERGCAKRPDRSRALQDRLWGNDESGDGGYDCCDVSAKQLEPTNDCERNERASDSIFNRRKAFLFPL